MGKKPVPNMPGPVYASMVIAPNGSRIAYISIEHFDDIDIAKDIASFLSQEDDNGGIGGIILDLRINGGGSISSLTTSISPFVRGPLLITTSRDGTVTHIDADENTIFRGGQPPIAILISHNTASAAELFAGILKGRCHATLIGETTTGLVDIATPLPLPNGSVLHLTTSRVSLANGVDPQWRKVGIRPDVFVAFSMKEYLKLQEDKALNAAVQLITEKLNGR